jgi:hypothetical protein
MHVHQFTYLSLVVTVKSDHGPVSVTLILQYDETIIIHSQWTNNLTCWKINAQ